MILYDAFVHLMAVLIQLIFNLFLAKKMVILQE